MVWHVVNQAGRSEADLVLLVTGAEADAVASAVIDLDPKIVFNNSYMEGQASSLVTGVRACTDLFEIAPDEPHAMVVVLGDQPTIRADVIDAVIDCWRETGAPVVQATYSGERAHPVLFDASMFLQLQTLKGDEGARRVIRTMTDRVEYVETGKSSVPPDIDTEADYQRLLREWSERES